MWEKLGVGKAPLVKVPRFFGAERARRTAEETPTSVWVPGAGALVGAAWRTRALPCRGSGVGEKQHQSCQRTKRGQEKLGFIFLPL